MKLSRLYASKLYQTSNRKDLIRASIDKAENVELVQQLSEYLDKDSRELLDEAIEENKPETEEQLDTDMEQGEGGPQELNEDIPDDRNVFSPSYSGGGGFSGPDMSEDFGEGEPDIFDMPDEGGESAEPAPEPVPDDSVEQSTAIYGKVTAETNLNSTDIVNQIDIIKGTLNSREDTAGILRIAIDEDELWIYYKDEVNIGDIMINVIEALNGANYTYLTFSRLARSNNAIVFDINEFAEPIKTVKEIEEEVK